MNRSIICIVFFILITSHCFNGMDNYLYINNVGLNHNKLSTKNGKLVFKNKLKKKTKLIEKDYQDISNFLIKNKNESMSEEVGYLLFEFFKENEVANKEYLTFLSKKDRTYKEHVLSELIQMMCVDLEDDGYTYKKLINDFSMFKGSIAAQQSFIKCVDNQVK